MTTTQLLLSETISASIDHWRSELTNINIRAMSHLPEHEFKSVVTRAKYLNRLVELSMALLEELAK